jgi:hypothetical protein
MFMVEAHALCLSCYHTFMTINQQKIEETERMLNYLAGQVEASVGMPLGLPRFPERRAPILAHQIGGMVTNIQFSNSVVGAINTGTIEHLQVSLSQISTGESRELAEALARFVEEAAASEELSPEQKNELAEQTDFVAEQVSLPKEGRRLAAVKAVLGTMKDTALTVTALGAAWDRIEPLLRAVFGF